MEAINALKKKSGGSQLFANISNLANKAHDAETDGNRWPGPAVMSILCASLKSYVCGAMPLNEAKPYQ